MHLQQLLDNRIRTLENELALARCGATTEKTNTIIREVCIDIWNIFVAKKVGYHAPSKPDHAYMSEAFFMVWEQSGRQSKLMTKIGVLEHETPMVVLRDRMLSTTDAHDLCNLLLRDLRLVWVTKQEDVKLSRAGLARSLPADGSSRYTAVGIQILPDLVQYKNL